MSTKQHTWYRKRPTIKKNMTLKLKRDFQLHNDEPNQIDLFKRIENCKFQ